MKDIKFQPDCFEDAQKRIWYSPSYLEEMMARSKLVGYSEGFQAGIKTKPHLYMIDVETGKESGKIKWE